MALFQEFGLIFTVARAPQGIPVFQSTRRLLDLERGQTVDRNAGVFGHKRGKRLLLPLLLRLHDKIICPIF